MAGKKSAGRSPKRIVKRNATKAKSKATTKSVKRAAAASPSLSNDLAAIRRRRFSA